jgi:hypothetical protein
LAKEIGESIFAQVSGLLRDMVNASTKDCNENLWKEVEDKLRPYPQKLEYLQGYYSTPKIARYHIQSICRSMDKVASAHAEQNHASIDRYIACSGVLEPEVLVQRLIQHQGELSAKRVEKDNCYNITALASSRHFREDSIQYKPLLALSTLHNEMQRRGGAIAVIYVCGVCIHAHWYFSLLRVSFP